MHPYRTHTCGELRSSDAGHEVRLSGWVHRKRDHGGVIFIDLRDHYGLTQVVVNPGRPFFGGAAGVRDGGVIHGTGEGGRKRGRQEGGEGERGTERGGVRGGC